VSENVGNYESLLSDSASESTDEGTQEVESSQATDQGESVDGQTPSENPSNTPESIEDPKSILEKLGKEEAAPEVNNALIEQINALNAIHNGMPIKVDSPEQLRELLQKGFDYTKKTMSHSEEVKAKTEEFTARENKFKEVETQLAQKEQEIQATVYENKIMENMLLGWKNSDPELFNYLSQAYQQEVNKFETQKPLIAQYENQFKQLNDRFAQFEQGKQQEELGQIRKSWETEMNDVQTRMAAPLAKIGVKPDWDKVKQAWSADSTNKMSVEDALYAAHGKDIAKANESYQKLLATKNKTQTRMLARSGVGSSAHGSKETIKVAPGNYEELLRQVSSQF